MLMLMQQPKSSAFSRLTANQIAVLWRVRITGQVHHPFKVVIGVRVPYPLQQKCTTLFATVVTFCIKKETFDWFDCDKSCGMPAKGKGGSLLIMKCNRIFVV